MSFEVELFWIRIQYDEYEHLYTRASIKPRHANNHVIYIQECPKQIIDVIRKWSDIPSHTQSVHIQLFYSM